jgi:hypothetical protein
MNLITLFASSPTLVLWGVSLDFPTCLLRMLSRYPLKSCNNARVVCVVKKSEL